MTREHAILPTCGACGHAVGVRFEWPSAMCLACGAEMPELGATIRRAVEPELRKAQAEGLIATEGP